jgi:hypothetical protein
MCDQKRTGDRQPPLGKLARWGHRAYSIHDLHRHPLGRVPSRGDPQVGLTGCKGFVPATRHGAYFLASTLGILSSFVIGHSSFNQ